jgi:hypothetical protein
MSNITPDLDRLLWQIAESKDPHAVSRFEAANPHLQGELASRMALVDGLRSMKPLAGAGSIPVFKPTTLAPLIPASWIAGGVIGAAMLGTVSYFGTKALTAPVTPPPTMASRVEAPRDTQPATPLRSTQPPPVVVQDLPPILHDQNVEEPVEPEGGPTVDLDRDARFDGKAQSEARYTFHLASAPLKSVLNAVAMQSGLKLEIAPGMPNPTVTVNVEGQSGMDVLRRLGDEFGFTPFEQGRRTVLIIPAEDGGRPTDPAPGG